MCFHLLLLLLRVVIIVERRDFLLLLLFLFVVDKDLKGVPSLHLSYVDRRG